MRLPGPPHRPSTGQSAYLWRLGGLAAAFIVFTAPALFHTPERVYPVLTIVFAGLLIAVTWMWDRVQVEPESPAVIGRRRLLLAATLSVIGLAYVAYGWVGQMLSHAYGADMLIMIREATQRFLSGRDPYSTYLNTYDAPWRLSLPYGPVLWGPYLVPQILQMDLRVVAIVGQLFVAAGCAAAAAVEVGRGRFAYAAAWVVVIAVLVLSITVREFTVLAHTPVYWPLLPLFAALVARRRWLLAAFALGVLIVARSTMVALVPILLMAVWKDDRPRLTRACAVLGLTVAAMLGPFALWDHRAMWDGMVESYLRNAKGFVWVSADRAAVNTFGVTGWLLSHDRGDLVERAQLVLMVLTCAAAWLAIRRGARSLPWMGLALFSFSMTTLWPVYYIYYDVLLLFVSAAIVEAFGPALRMRAWLATLAAVIVLVAATTSATTVAAPSMEIGAPSAQRAFFDGFGATEREGNRWLVWVVSKRAATGLPRNSTAPAYIEIDCRPFLTPDPPQIVTVMLNGRTLVTHHLQDGWQTIRVPAPRGAWRIGFNRLDILSASITTLPDNFPAEDLRPRAFALSRIEVIPLE